MSKMNGLLGKIADDIFHDGAKLSTNKGVHQYTTIRDPDAIKNLKPKFEHYSKEIIYNTFSYTDKLGKYVGMGIVAGGTGTLATNTYNNYSNGESLTNNMGAAILRGAALGAVGGAAVNTVPKVIKNQLGKTGIRTFDGGAKILGDIGNIWSPVAEEFAATRKAKKLATIERNGGKKNFNPFKKDEPDAIDKVLKLVSDTKKELKASGNTNEGELAFRVQKNLVDQLDPHSVSNRGGNVPKDGKKGLTVDDLVRVKNTQMRLNQSVKDTDEYLSGKKGGAAIDFMVWGQETEQDLSKLKGAKKAGVIGALATQMGFKSAYHHIVQPTGDLINNIRKGQFKDINFSQGAAAAFSAYGLYETGSIVNEAGEGNWGGVAGGLAMLAGGKLMFGLAMDYSKANAEMVAKGIGMKDAIKASRALFASKSFTTSAAEMTQEQHETLFNMVGGKARQMFEIEAPSTYKLVQEYEQAKGDNAKLFNLGLKAFKENSVVEAIKSDYSLHKKDPSEAIETLKYYRDNHAGNLALMGVDIGHSNKENILKWNSRYTNTLSDMRRDFMNERVDINYEKVVEGLLSKDKANVMNSASDLLSGSKWFADRANTLAGKGTDLKGGVPIYQGVRDPWVWGELGGNFALGVGTTYGMDYMARGEDASLAQAVAMGGAIQLATAGHILGNAKKYFAKTPVKGAT